jgi:hypothetical protein
VKDDAPAQPDQPEQQDVPAPKRTRAKQSKPAPFNPSISMRWDGDAEPDWHGTLDALVRMNELDPKQDAEFIEEMRTDLRETGEYKGGGGAAPVYILKVVEETDADAEEQPPQQPATKPKRKRAKQSAPVATSAAPTTEAPTEPTAPDEPAQAPKRGRGRKRKPSAITLATLTERYLANLVADQRSDATVGAYKSDLAIAQRVLGAETAIDAITPKDVALFNASDEVLLARSGAEKAKPTIDRTRRVLRLALDYAEAEGWIMTTPCVEPGDEPQA